MRLTAAEYARRNNRTLAALYNSYAESHSTAGLYEHDVQNIVSWYSYAEIDTWHYLFDLNDYQQLRTYVLGRDFSGLQRFLATGAHPTSLDLNILGAYLHAGIERFDMAAQLYREVELQANYPLHPDYFSMQSTDPFWSRDVGPRRRSFRRYLRSELYDSLSVLQRKANATSATAREILQYAHALYSISFHGVSWYLSRGERHNVPERFDHVAAGRDGSLFSRIVIPQARRSPFAGTNTDYYDLQRVERTFRKALQRATNDDERGEAEFMLALCDRDRQVNRHLLLDVNPFTNDLFSLVSFAKFQKYYNRYGSTPFAQRSWCPLLATNVRRSTTAMSLGHVSR